MKNETRRAVLLTAVPSIVTALLVQACLSGGDATAQAAAVVDLDPVEGVWEAVITGRDCATGAVLGTFRGIGMFHRGGTLTDTNAAPPSTRGVGMGVWKRTGAGPGYTAAFRFNRYNPDGSLAGSQKVTRSFTLSADGNTQTSTNTASVIDLTGAVVQSQCATDVSTRSFAL